MVVGALPTTHVIMHGKIISLLKKALYYFVNIDDSDHCGLYFDINSDVLFDSNEEGPKNITQGGLQLDRPATVLAYIQHLRQLYERHKIPQRALLLEKDIHNTSDPAKLQVLYSKFSSLDLERIRYMKRAESLCHQPKNSSYEWSPTLAKMGGRVSYWKQRKAALMEGRSHTINHSQLKHLSIKDTGEQESTYINLHLRAAWADLHTTQKRQDI